MVPLVTAYQPHPSRFRTVSEKIRLRIDRIMGEPTSLRYRIAAALLRNLYRGICHPVSFPLALTAFAILIFSQ